MRLSRVSPARVPVFLGFFFLSAIGSAQVNTGRISGLVHDPAGARVPGVVLRATNEMTGIVTTATTQEDGDYLVNFLIPGNYRLETEKAGFQRTIHTGIAVTAGGISRIDITLTVGET